LKFPFQNSEGLVDIVVANKNFQSKLLSQGETQVRGGKLCAGPN